MQGQRLDALRRSAPSRESNWLVGEESTSGAKHWQEAPGSPNGSSVAAMDLAWIHRIAEFAGMAMHPGGDPVTTRTGEPGRGVGRLGSAPNLEAADARARVPGASGAGAGARASELSPRECRYADRAGGRARKVLAASGGRLRRVIPGARSRLVALKGKKSPTEHRSYRSQLRRQRDRGTRTGSSRSSPHRHGPRPKSSAAACSRRRRRRCPRH